MTLARIIAWEIISTILMGSKKVDMRAGFEVQDVMSSWIFFLLSNVYAFKWVYNGVCHTRHTQLAYLTCSARLKVLTNSN